MPSSLRRLCCDVADAVERRELLGEEAARLLGEARHRVGVGVLVAGQGSHLSMSVTCRSTKRMSVSGAV